MQIKLTDKYKELIGNEPPKFATSGSVGIDLYACISSPIRLSRMDKVMIPSGIHLDIGSSLNNVAAIMIPRSSTGSKGFSLANTIGVIDTDYTGEILMCIQNTSLETIEIEPKMRIAQLLFVPVLKPVFTVVDEITAKTERNSGGFGSTGK